MNETRLQLQKGDHIRLFRSQDSSDVWQISDVVGEGGSAICYEAVSGNKTGRLKEFYPLQYGTQILMKRTASQQLLPARLEKKREFYDLCDAFAEIYLKLERTKTADKDNEILNNFIPPYEILYGLDEAGVRGSVYIWTPDDKKGIKFDEYLAEIRQDPGKDGWSRLYEIICIMHTVTDCVKMIHKAGFLHLDLKPSNFLIPYTSGKLVNTGTISLFDINTLYDIDSAVPMIAGSKGTQAPETKRGRADNRSDIYSIGGMLFQVFLDPEDYDPEGLYFDDYYEFIEHIIDHSELICKSEVGGDRYVRYWLTTILKKCLARRPESRYGSCEELMKDLEGLRTFLEYMRGKKTLEAFGQEKEDGGNAEEEQKRDLLCSTEIKVPFSPCLESYKMIELEQNCSIGIDISHTAVQVAVGKEKDWFLIPLGENREIELSMVGYRQENKDLSMAIFHDIFKRIWNSLLQGGVCNTEKITAILSLPADMDTEEIDVICRIAAMYGIYIRRVIDRTAALAAAAWKISEESCEEETLAYRSMLICLFDGDRFQIAAFEKWEDLDLDTKRVSVNLKGKEAVYAQGIAAETCLEIFENMVWRSVCRQTETAVVLKAFGKGNPEIRKQAEEKGLFLFPENHGLLPCYGAMLMNDMMRMIQPKILQVDSVPSFDIYFRVAGQECRTVVMKGVGLSHQYREICFDLPPSEAASEMSIFRTTFGHQEKQIASVSVPGNRYLYRKVYIYTELQQNQDMTFRIEVIARNDWEEYPRAE